MARKYKARGKVWLWPGGTHSTSSGQEGTWHFAHVDKKTSETITYLLPLKTAIRRAEAISEGDTITFTLTL